MADSFEFAIENERAFLEYLREVSKDVSDFRIPFRKISSDFYRSQKIIWGLKTPGKYAPLGGFNPNRIVAGLQTARERAETKKERNPRIGFAYPILVGENRNLKDSTLSSNHRYSVFILGRQELIIGTNAPYAKYHQAPFGQPSGPRTKIPERRFVFIDGGPRDGSTSSKISGRSERWFDIINVHVAQVLAGAI